MTKKKERPAETPEVPKEEPKPTETELVEPVVIIKPKKKKYPEPDPIPKEGPVETPCSKSGPAPGPPGSWHG